MRKDPPSHNVLIVEDHAVVREGLTRLIDDEPDLNVIGTAVDHASALELLAAARPDVAIVDLSLGYQSGLELIKAISNLDSRVAVLVLSMHDDAVFAERALRAGARGYVNKLEAIDVLLNAVRRILAGEVWLGARARTIVLESVISRDVNRSLPRGLRGGSRLSDRELEVLGLLGAGMGTREIARRLVVSVKTVESHRANLKEKLRLRTSNELVVYAARWTGNGGSQISHDCDC